MRAAAVPGSAALSTSIASARGLLAVGGPLVRGHLAVQHREDGGQAPGGHLDENELPEEAAIRECKEETGLDVEIVDGGADFYGRNRIQGTTMKLPAAMFLENIPAFGGTAEKPAQPEHQHMDFVFVCRRKDPSQPIAPESPDDVVRWFTMDDVRAMGPGEIYENARSFILSR